MTRDWKRARLGDISSIDYGYTAKASFEEIGPKFLRITDLQNGSVDWSEVPSCEISDGDLSKHKLLDQDIVFARTGATTGKSYLVSEPPAAIAASYLIRLRLNAPKISAKYVSLYFQTDEYWSLISAGISGSAQGGFNASKLADVSLPVPPLAEQKRIVAILDEAFAGIAAATANAEKNLANARELFENYVDSVFLQQSESWIEKPLGSIGGDVFTGPFGSLLHKADYVTGGTPLVNPAHIIDGKIIPDTEKTIDLAALERLQNYRLKAGDVVIGRRGEIGRCAVVTAREDGWLCGTGCFYIRVFEDTNPHFLAALLRSKHYRQKLEVHSTGATMLNLSNTTLSEFKIRVPPLAEQNNLMKAMEGLSTQIELLEIVYQKKLSALADLKQAILQKAFSGELTGIKTRHCEAA